MFLFYDAVVESVEDTGTIIPRKKVDATNKSYLYYNRNVPSNCVDLSGKKSTVEK